MREQLAIQAMFDIARAHDRPSEPAPILENLAAYQQVPIEMMQRMLDALEADGLLQRSAGYPPAYLPGASLQRIRLLDILRSARRAEEDGYHDSLRSDAPVSALLGELDQDLAHRLGDTSLADLLKNPEDNASDEDSLV